MRQSRFFQDGHELSVQGFNKPIQIRGYLGAGSQGQVYKAIVNGHTFALKWYYPGYAKQDRGIAERLRRAIAAGPPSRHYIWPLYLIEEHQAHDREEDERTPGLGYLMRLRPDAFIACSEHYGGNIDISIQNVIITCKSLCEGIHALHSHGFCYKDLSLGNIFMSPETGDVLICDNDNAEVNGKTTGTVIGTPGFIAPEVIAGKEHPNTYSDLFSLANVIFRLLIRHDPFCGQREAEEKLLDEDARRRLYYKEPIFIFNPSDNRNRPDPEYHTGVQEAWNIYPSFIRRMLTLSFVDGLVEPSKRVVCSEWIEELGRLLDCRVVCRECESESFISDSTYRSQCWNCGLEVSPQYILQIGNRNVCASKDTQIYHSHFGKLDHTFSHESIGLVIEKQSDKEMLGLKNTSRFQWTGLLTSGRHALVDSGKACDLSAFCSIDTGVGRIEIEPIRN